MDRRTARETALTLIFESQFQNEVEKEEIYALARQDRDLEEDAYMRAVFFASVEHRAEIDEMIERLAVGWTLKRISRVALAVLRLSITEMLYLPDAFRADIPYWVSINEALELIKRYDHDVSPRFINGILNAAAQEAGLKKQTPQAKKDEA